MDQISDMIIRIKNAQAVSKETVSFPYSKMKLAIAELLEKEGFVKSVAKKGKKVFKSIEVELIYNEDGSPKVTEVSRVSKPSKRIYRPVTEIHSVKHGAGLLVLSTPKGILSGKQALKEKVGGEVLFKIY
jgi:small subunit ribosomal protein S8